MDHKTYESLCDIAEIKCQLIEWVKEEVGKGKESIETKEMGEVVDMIKDLAEAEKLCMEKCYYESVVEAMDDASGDYRMGYGGERKMHKRYPDEMMWDKPYVNQMPYVEDYLDGRYGYQARDSRGRYTGGTSSNPSGMRGNSRSGYPDWRDHGGNEVHRTPYDRYREMRRHYSETGSQSDREEMSASAKEHLMDTTESIRDIWKDADPEMRRKIKADISALASSLN